jgi:hypothetical protein
LGGYSTPTSKAQLNHFVANVLIPRVQDMVSAASDGVEEEKLRDLFQKNIESGLKFFLSHWKPVHQELYGLDSTQKAIDTIQQLKSDVMLSSDDAFHLSLVKVLWYLLSLSLDDMGEVPVFPDQLTYMELEVAIRNATRTIS